MADSYIDQYETLAYGEFAATQITELVVGLDPELDDAVRIVAKRLAKKTAEMRAVLGASEELERVTYRDNDEVVATAKDVLRRLVRYAESRKGGHDIARDILNGQSLTTVLRRRPAKLADALKRAMERVAAHADALAEGDAYVKELKAAKHDLDGLNTNVRRTRAARTEMTPQVANARSEWLAAYAQAKLVVEGVLRPLGKVGLLPQVFDDLAEVHQVAGVQDGPAPGATGPAGTPPTS